MRLCVYMLIFFIFIQFANCQKNQTKKEANTVNKTKNIPSKTAVNNTNNNTDVKLNNSTKNETRKRKKIKNTKTENSFKSKLKKFLRQDDDLNFYIVLGSIIFTVVILIVFGTIFLILYRRRKKFMRLNEEKVKNMNMNISISGDPKKYEKVQN